MGWKEIFTSKKPDEQEIVSEEPAAPSPEPKLEPLIVDDSAVPKDTRLDVNDRVKGLLDQVQAPPDDLAEAHEMLDTRRLHLVRLPDVQLALPPEDAEERDRQLLRQAQQPELPPPGENPSA